MRLCLSDTIIISFNKVLVQQLKFYEKYLKEVTTKDETTF